MLSGVMLKYWHTAFLDAKPSKEFTILNGLKLWYKMMFLFCKKYFCIKVSQLCNIFSKAELSTVDILYKWCTKSHNLKKSVEMMLQMLSRYAFIKRSLIKLH